MNKGMKGIELRQGGFYRNVSTILIREIVELSQGMVRFRAYNLATGFPWPSPGCCMELCFLKWCSREATDDEISQLHPIPTSGVT